MTDVFESVWMDSFSPLLPHTNYHEKFMSVRYNQIGYVCIFKFEITSDFNCAYFFFVHKIKRDFEANKFAETKTTLREKSKTKPFKMCTQNDSNIKKAKQIKNFNKHVVLSATRVWFFLCCSK